MNFGRPPPQSSGIKVTSKVVSIYTKLFQGIPPSQIVPGQQDDEFFSDLLDLKVDRPYLEGELDTASKDMCLGHLKVDTVTPFLSALFKACLKQMRTAKHEDSKKTHAVETQYILVSRLLAKNLTGWEVMDVFAGSVAQSDAVFKEYTEIIDVLMGDAQAPAGLRHLILQLALAYMCSASQLSTGAYFLRRDFFPSIVTLVNSHDTEQYAFEAILFLAILANYHKSDAAKLNPYLKRIRQSTDGDFMRKLCWASNFALQTAINAYQDISDDSIAAPLNLTSSVESVMTRLRPDRILSFSPLSLSKDKYKDQPIEACVVLLPIYEFLRANPLFATVLLEDLVAPSSASDESTALPCTLITFSSYLWSHASSTSSPRSIAYASLSLNMMLSLVENNVVMEFMTQTNIPSIRLCRQRLPVLPTPRAAQAPICSVLDCCLLWLRHNLHKRLEVHSYTNCIWICYRIVWFLQYRRIRLSYDWTLLWSAIIGLLNFLSSKIDALPTTGGVHLLASETIRLLDFALCASESYLPSPQALHELIYELVRSSAVLRKQEGLLKSLAIPHSISVKPSYASETIEDTLAHLLSVTDHYAEKIARKGAGIGNPKDVMKIVADEIEAHGIHAVKEARELTPITRSQDVLDFARFACADVLALMP